MGTPIPCKENEQRGTTPSNLVEYTLTPEELAKYRAMPKPKSKKSKSRREHEMAFTMNKEEYLAAIASGKSKTDIAKERGITLPALLYWIKKWGITAEAEPQPVKPVEAPTPKVEMQLDEAEPEFDWITPDDHISGSSIRITKGGLWIKGDVIEHLNKIKPALVGCMHGESIAVKNSDSGWSLRVRREKHTLVIYSKPLLESIVERGFPFGSSGTAEWDEKRQMIIAHMEKGVS